MVGGKTLIIKLYNVNLKTIQLCIFHTFFKIFKIYLLFIFNKIPLFSLSYVFIWFSLVHNYLCHAILILLYNMCFFRVACYITTFICINPHVTSSTIEVDMLCNPKNNQLLLLVYLYMYQPS